MQGVLTFLLFIAMFAIGIFYLYAGVVGIGIEFGTGWAIAAFIAAMVLRFSLPLSVGAFFYATNVWGWGTLGGLVFAFPFVGLQLLLLTGNIFVIVADKFKRN